MTLRSVLDKKLDEKGWLSVADYMQLCLYHPEYGRYCNANPIGAAGDFTTAPEISQVFGELIGLWFAATWQAMGDPEPIRLVELGPGRGTLMADALRALRVMPELARALDVELVEISPALRRIQAKTLADAGPRVRWAEGRAPESVAGATVLIANEFLDALAIEQAVRCDGTWAQRSVRRGPDGALEFGSAPLDGERAPPWLADVGGDDGTVAEWRNYGRSPAGTPGLLDALSAIAACGPMAALFVDYGYDGEVPATDTFQGVAAHRYVSPLAAPGDADLTAHVDFGDLRRQCLECGLQMTRTVTQGEFLTALGIEARLARLLVTARPHQVNAIEAGVHRLMAPAGMGGRFRVCVVHNGSRAPHPFVDERTA